MTRAPRPSDARLTAAEKTAIRAIGWGGIGSDYYLESLDLSVRRYVYVFRVWWRWSRRFCS